MNERVGDLGFSIGIMIIEEFRNEMKLVLIFYCNTLLVFGNPVRSMITMLSALNSALLHS